MLVREDCQTDEKHGCSPAARTLENHLKFGVINLDKPAGPTSHQVADWVKKIVSAKRAGHSGTLDPAVTGVLPTALNNATKVLYALLPAGKEYVGVMHLHKEVEEAKLRQVTASFVGQILQTPPVRSAVKRVERIRTVYDFQILEIEGKDVLFRTNVQAGTYIRKLCDDMGKQLGGAHMAELRRTRAGPFLEKDSVTFQDLADALAENDETKLRQLVLPVEAAVVHLKRVWVKDGAIEALCSGAALAMPGIAKLDEGIETGELISIFSLKEELVALGVSKVGSQELLTTPKGFGVVLQRVIMESGIYPRAWKR